MSGQFTSVRKTGWKMAMAAGLVLAAAWAHGNDQLQPRAMLQNGQQWQFSEESSQNMDMTLGGQGGQQLKQLQTHLRKGTLEVLATKDGQATAIKVTYDPACDDNASQNGQGNDTPFPLAGKTVVVRKDDLGIITIDGAAADQAVSKELTQMLTPLHPMLPSNPVGVGDSWDANKDAMNKEFELGPGDSADTKVKYSRTDQVDGQKTAALDLTGHIKKSQGGLNFAFDLKGSAQIDLGSGQTLQTDIDGQMTVDGQTQTPQGQAINVQGNGTMKNHATMRLVNGAGGAAAVNNNPVATGGNNNAAANPLGGAGADSAFTGDFHGDKLSASLASDGQGGIKGTLQMGDQKFPATAKVINGKLVGTFTTQGNSFDFTATVEGSTMTISSGGSDYSMKKAVANPLSGGGGSQANNPLAH